MNWSWTLTEEGSTTDLFFPAHFYSEAADKCSVEVSRWLSFLCSRPRHSLTFFLLLLLFCFAPRRTLQLARLLKDKAVEAQACYSLGNTYTLLQDYERAIDYHLKHLVIAQNLNDRYWVPSALPYLGDLCLKELISFILLSWMFVFGQ